MTNVTCNIVLIIVKIKVRQKNRILKSFNTLFQRIGFGKIMSVDFKLLHSYLSLILNFKF